MSIEKIQTFVSHHPTLDGEAIERLTSRDTLGDFLTGDERNLLFDIASDLERGTIQAAEGEDPSALARELRRRTTDGYDRTARESPASRERVLNALAVGLWLPPAGGVMLASAYGRTIAQRITLD